MSATTETKGLVDRNSIRLSLGKSVRWVNDEGGWEIGRVVLTNGKRLVDGYFGGRQAHHMVQGYHGGLFFVKDTILEDAPDRSTYEDKDGNPLAIPKEENGPSVGPIESYWPKEPVKSPSDYPNGHQRIMESSAAYEKAKAAERTIPSWVVEEYNKEHKRKQACNLVEQAATLDCRKGKSIQCV